MHPLARVAVERVRRKVGERFDPLDAFAWLRRLDDLARLIDNPPVADRAALLDAPVMVGPVAFYRPSFAACEVIATRFESMEGRTFELAVAWALSHARDVAALRRMLGISADEARREVVAWALTIPCSYDAVVAVVRDLMKRPKDSAASNGADVNFGSVVSVLMETFGQTAEYWAFAPVDEIRQRLVDRAARYEAERRAIAASSKRTIAPDPDSHSARAMIRFNDAAREFEAWAIKHYEEKS